MTALMDFPRPYGVLMAEAARAGVCQVTVEPTLEEALALHVAWQVPGGRLEIGTMAECPTVELEHAAKTWLGYLRKPVVQADRLAYWLRYRAARLVLDSREDAV